MGTRTWCLTATPPIFLLLVSAGDTLNSLVDGLVHALGNLGHRGLGRLFRFLRNTLVRHRATDPCAHGGVCSPTLGRREGGRGEEESELGGGERNGGNRGKDMKKQGRIPNKQHMMKL